MSYVALQDVRTYCLFLIVVPTYTPRQIFSIFVLFVPTVPNASSPNGLRSSPMKTLNSNIFKEAKIRTTRRQNKLQYRPRYQLSTFRHHKIRNTLIMYIAKNHNRARVADSVEGTASPAKTASHLAGPSRVVCFPFSKAAIPIKSVLAASRRICRARDSTCRVNRRRKAYKVIGIERRENGEPPTMS